MKKLILLFLLCTNCYAASWECIARFGTCHTWRLQVYKGWIVSGDNSAGGGEHGYAMTFVPDPEYRWQL